MEHVAKFTNQSQGRDRVFRATQHACALCSYLLRDHSDRKALVQKLNRLENNMKAGRKLFRLGNTVNSLEAAKQSARLSDPVLCLCLTMANLSRALYFICDNVLWLQSVGLVPRLHTERWGRSASRCYLLSLLMCLTRDAYVLVQLTVRRAREREFQKRAEEHLRESPEVAEPVLPQLDALVFLLLEVLRSHPAVALDMLKNVCDLLIPMDKLEIYRSNAGAVGFCGLLSSLIGIMTLVQPKLKIKP